MKTTITLYEFYAMGINQLMKQTSWGATNQVSPYKQSFQYEQRIIALVILALLGEEYVPEEALKTMPHMREQVKASINQTVFLRALKHYYRHYPEATAISERALQKMESYMIATRYAQAKGINPLAGIMDVLLRRVPVHSKNERTAYQDRIKKILQYSQALVQQSLAQKYTIKS